MEEAVEIYLPLSRLLNLYVAARQNRNSVLHQFLDRKETAPPFIIGIAGSVAVGKKVQPLVYSKLCYLVGTTTLKKVELVTTDGFFVPQRSAAEKGLMSKKGSLSLMILKR